MGTIEYENLSSALFGITRRKLLGLFFSRSDQSFYLRQIVRITGAGQGTVQRELKRLVEAGIIIRSKWGRQVHYQVNKDCPIFKDLQGLMMKTAGLADELRKALAPLSKKIEIAVIYGSQASGTAESKSDVDLLVVGKLDELDLHRRITGAEENLTRTVNYILLDKQEFDRRRQEQGGFLDRILKGDLIFIIGHHEKI